MLFLPRHIILESEIAVIYECPHLGCSDKVQGDDMQSVMRPLVDQKVTFTAIKPLPHDFIDAVFGVSGRQAHRKLQCSQWCRRGPDCRQS